MARWLVPLVLLALLPASASAAPLAHSSWRVARISGHDVRSTHQRLRFSGHHGFSGRHLTGCGLSRFAGRYQTSGTALLFTDVSVTGEGCASRKGPPSILGVIFGTRSYRLHGRKLELLGRRGHTLAVLKRR